MQIFVLEHFFLAPFNLLFVCKSRQFPVSQVSIKVPLPLLLSSVVGGSFV
jgi:hypothetical protein